MLGIHHHRAGVRCFTSDIAQYGSLSQHYAGIHAIAVDRIVGSVGRSHELRPDFMPVGTRWGCPLGDGRYQSIRAALRQGLSLPAIEVYKLGDCYYVLDGHHRVAAARAIGQTSLDAVVTEFQPILAGTGQVAAA